MENIKLLNFKIEELNTPQTIAIYGGHNDIALDRDSAIMMARALLDFIEGFCEGFGL